MTGSRFLLRSLAVTALVIVASGACANDDGGDMNAGGPSTSTVPGAASPDRTVEIVNFVFEPKSLTVKAGTTVTWTNEDTAIHSVKDTSALATPVSADLGKGATFSISYGQPGSYSYICGIHQYMTGSVQVVA